MAETEARCKEGNIQIMLFSSFRVGRRYGAGAAAVIIVKFLDVLKSGAKKTGHFYPSVAHQISILALKFIKRGPNEMS